MMPLLCSGSLRCALFPVYSTSFKISSPRFCQNTHHAPNQGQACSGNGQNGLVPSPKGSQLPRWTRFAPQQVHTAPLIRARCGATHDWYFVFCTPKKYCYSVENGHKSYKIAQNDPQNTISNLCTLYRPAVKSGQSAIFTGSPKG